MCLKLIDDSYPADLVTDAHEDLSTVSSNQFLVDSRQTDQQLHQLLK